MESLKTTISILTNPHPKVVDPEDDDVSIETSADIKEQEEIDELFNAHNLRVKTAPLLEDIDPRYAGKKVSRESLENIFNDRKFTSSTSDDDTEDESEEFEVSDENLEDFQKSLLESSFSYKESQEGEEASDDQEQLDEQEQSETSDEIDSESGDMINQFSTIDVTSEIEKGKSVKLQQELWNRLCECRIKLQKLLVLANKFPQSDCWQKLKDKCSQEPEDLNKGSSCVKALLSNMLDLQAELVQQIPETNNLENVKNVAESKSDEEILSDTDEEMDQGQEKVEPEIKCVKRKLKRSEDYNELLAKRHKALIPYRNSVIQKWDEKTRLATGRMTQKSFAAFDNSVLKQIEQILQDKTRLIKRTQLKRSLYRVLGKPIISEKEIEENADIDKSKSKQDMLLKDYDPEIFDDDDFYRQLLKDVIENKSADIDPSLLRKQMDIQKIRNKMKRKVDTKASKGRKLRYDVHPKLVNFMAPVQTSLINDEARDNLLKCLFGKNSAQT